MLKTGVGREKGSYLLQNFFNTWRFLPPVNNFSFMFIFLLVLLKSPSPDTEQNFKIISCVFIKLKWKRDILYNFCITASFILSWLLFSMSLPHQSKLLSVSYLETHPQRGTTSSEFVSLPSFLPINPYVFHMAFREVC